MLLFLPVSVPYIRPKQSGDQHEEHHDEFDPGVVERRDARIAGAEPAGSDGRERVADRVEPAHPDDLQQHGLDQRQSDVNDDQDLQRFLGAVPEIVLGHRRQFDARKSHLGRAHRRQHDQNEHHDPRRLPTSVSTPSRTAVLWVALRRCSAT